MKALQIIEQGKIVLTDIPRPVVQVDEVLVKIRYVGFCGSDLNTWLGKNPLAKMPVIPGHEIGGIIEALGENVPKHLVAGMSCTVNPYTACDSCTSCRNGRPNACRYNQTFGVQRDGAMCEFISVPWKKVIADADITPKHFCLVEPLSVGFHAVERGGVSDLDTVMVLGCGMIGVGAIVRSALRGARVIAVDVDDEKLKLAKQLGAAFTINSTTENLHDRVMTITNDFGIDVVIEAVGMPETYRIAINETAFTGRVVFIGYAKNEISFDTKLFVQKELDVRGSRNAMPEDFRAVMEYIKKGNFPIDEMISGIYSVDKAQEVLENWSRNTGRVFRVLVEF